MRKFVWPIVAMILSVSIGKSQCLEIESILVDACVPGSGCSSLASPSCNCEGKNEMVRFKTGNAAVLLNDIFIDFPNNTYQGIHSPDAGTASKVSFMNSTIQACGYLLEPISGSIPANKQVLLVTSTDMCTTANSFTNLNDTLYIIFQNAGNYQGHFANCSSTGNRSLIMGLNSNASCRDTVTYNCQQLINVNGNYTCNSSLMDGSTVNFDAAGNATYVNYGCQAPFTPLNIFASSSSPAACTQDQVLLTSLTSGNVFSIAWSGGNGTFSTASNDSTLYSPVANDSGTLTLIVTASTICGSTVSDSVQLIISQNPTAGISSTAGDTICEGQNTTLNASGGSSYVWLPWNISSNFVTVDSSGTYSVVSSNACGSDTASFVLEVSLLPDVLISLSGNNGFCTGDSITLIASGAESYLWNNGSTNDSLVVTNSGFYSVNGNNSCGNDSAGISITTTAVPTISITSPATLICDTGSVQLTAIAQSATTVSWLPGNLQSSVYTADSSGTYTAIAQNNCGSDTAQITIQTESPLMVTISSSAGDTICNGSATTLTAGGASSFNWSTGQQTSAITVNSAGNYFVIASNSCGTDSASFQLEVLNQPSVNITAGNDTICSGSAVTLMATAINYSQLSWSDGSSSDSIIVNAAGIYSVIAENDCGADTAFQTIYIAATPSITVTATQDTICPGQSTVLSANANTSFIWSTGTSANSITVSAAGNYFAIANNLCGTDTAFISITSLALPAVSLTSSNDTICNGQTATLTANVSGSNNVTWNNGSSLSSITVSTGGNYYAIASNFCGSDTGYILIGVSTSPDALIFSSSSIICPGESALLTAGGNGNFYWLPGGSGDTLSVSQGGTYVLIAQNACGTDTASIVITESNVNAQFSASPSSGVYPLNVNFTNSSVNAVSYSWTFGNDSMSTQTNPSTVYLLPGNYTVSLIAVNSDGCADTSSSVIIVLLSEPFIVVPNIFSPNGDSLNDLFQVSYYGIDSYTITITDRWGLLIFESADITRSWNGKTPKGDAVPEGTYFYLIEAAGTNGKPIELKGYLLLTK